MDREYFDTAWEVHEFAMQEMEIYQPYGDSPRVVKKGRRGKCPWIAPMQPNQISWRNGT